MRFRDRLPVIEEHPPLPPVFEKYELPSPSQIKVIVEERPPLPRVWFLNANKTELIQVQSNRFIRNWRKTEDLVPYPRYEPIRERFRKEVSQLEAFLKDEDLGALAVNQCEVSYVNHIERDDAWTSHGQLDRVFSIWSRLAAASILPDPEDASIHVRYVIPDESGKPLGRLHAVVQPGWRKIDNAPMFILNLTARGTPVGEGIDGAFSFFDLGRRWIVKGFADLTTPDLQRVWGRKDA